MSTQSTDTRPSLPAILLAGLTLVVFVSYFVLISTASTSVIASGNNGNTGGNDDNGGTDDEVEFEIDLLDEDMSPPGSLSEHGHLADLEDGRITYHSAGSSSCPPTIERVSIREIDGGENIILHPKTYPPDTMCTMDIRGFTQEIYRADGEDIPEDTNIIVDSQQQSVVPGVRDRTAEPREDNRGMEIRISPLN